MKIARHNLPGEGADTIRPLGNGLIRGARLCSPSKTIGYPGSTHHTVPYGTDFLRPGFQAFRAWLPSFCPPGAKAPSLKREHDHLSPPP
jgi:hypothetical protein